ncbi:MAG: peptidylprolyl isomerase [Anaerolineae bacterium]
MKNSRHLLVLLCIVLSLAGCAGRTSPGPEATLAPGATPLPSSTPVTPEPGQESVTPAAVQTPTAVPGPTRSPAEEARDRNDAISAALEYLIRPESGEVVATVNGEEITVPELESAMRLRMDGLAVQYGVSWDEEDAGKLVPQLEADVLSALIETKLILQGAQRDGVTVDEAELAGLAHEVQQAIVENQGYASWDEYLTTLQMSQDTFMQMISQSLLVNQLIRGQQVPSEEEQVHARHILVRDPALAQELLKKLEAGGDFATLAQENSVDEGTAARGGDLDWFPRGLMVPEFEDAAFALEIGSVSDVVTSTFGFHIIQVLERETRPLSGAAQQQLQQMAFSEWLNKLRSEATIERFVVLGEG